MTNRTLAVLMGTLCVSGTMLADIGCHTARTRPSIQQAITPIGVAQDTSPPQGGASPAAGSPTTFVLDTDGPSRITISVEVEPIIPEPTPVLFPKVVPWLECNTASGPLVESAIEGLLLWQRVTNTAIVSTVPGCSSLYTTLRERVPGMRIIPGMKTATALDRLDSVKGWTAIAAEVAAIMESSGETTVLLENESAAYLYLKGRQSFFEGLFRKGLIQLPKADYIWYEGLRGVGAELRRHETVCEIAVELLGAQLAGQSMGGPRNVYDNPIGMAALRERHKLISDKPASPLIYFYGPDYTWWQDDQVIEALGFVRNEWGVDTWAIIYPGSGRWVEAATELPPILLAGEYRTPDPQP